MEKKIKRFVITLWVLVALMVVVPLVYSRYQWYELEKVEHEVDLMYTYVK
jgi:hypothetical protein